MEGKVLGPCVSEGATRQCTPAEVQQLTLLLNQQSSTIDLRWLLLAIPLVGIGVSVFVWFGIEAARFSHTKLRKQWRAYRKNCGGLRELPLLAGGGSRFALAFGYYAPRLIPWVFIVAWTFLIAIGISRVVAYGVLYIVLAVWVLYVGSTVKSVVKVVDDDSDDEPSISSKREEIA